MRKTVLLSTAALFLGAGCASMQGTATVPSARTGMMAAKITEAEFLGAQKCSPQALAKAKIALDHVSHEMEEGYYHPVWLEDDLVAAEKAVAALLVERKTAARPAPRLHCGSDVLTVPGESGSRPEG